MKLRATYDNSLRGEFQKVGKLYHGRLVELKKSYMQAQNLEGAVAVDAEIKKLRETHGKMVVKVPEPQRKASPLNGAWVVHAHGKATCLCSMRTRWQMTGARYGNGRKKTTLS